jgi:hypothetical protein
MFAADRIRLDGFLAIRTGAGGVLIAHRFASNW